MKYLLLLVYVLICSTPLISQTDEVELPKYEGVQPTWQRIVQDDIRDQPFRGVNIQTLLEDGYMYYSATTDTMFEGTFEQTICYKSMICLMVVWYGQIIEKARIT